MPEVLNREQCGLRPPRFQTLMRPKEEYFGCITHHGASADNPPDPVAVWRAYQRWHMDHNGWSDIGYSWGVANDGRVLEGRGWGIWGTHTIGYNGRAHAVCYIGDDNPSQAALESIWWLHSVSDWLMGRVGNHTFHGAVNQTTCAGHTLNEWMAAGMPGPWHTPAPVVPLDEEEPMWVFAKDPSQPHGYTPMYSWSGDNMFFRMEDDELDAVDPNWLENRREVPLKMIQRGKRI